MTARTGPRAALLGAALIGPAGCDRGAPPDPEAAALRRLDLDGDGGLGRDELRQLLLPGAVEAGADPLQPWDADGSGKLDAAELGRAWRAQSPVAARLEARERLARPRGAPPPPAPPPPAPAGAAPEHPAVAAELLRRMDLNGDGGVDAGELGALVMPADPSGARPLGGMDGDGDGRLGAAELERAFLRLSPPELTRAARGAPPKDDPGGAP